MRGFGDPRAITVLARLTRGYADLEANVCFRSSVSEGRRGIEFGTRRETDHRDFEVGAGSGLGFNRGELQKRRDSYKDEIANARYGGCRGRAQNQSSGVGAFAVKHGASREREIGFDPLLFAARQAASCVLTGGDGGGRLYPCLGVGRGISAATPPSLGIAGNGYLETIQTLLACSSKLEEPVAAYFFHDRIPIQKEVEKKPTVYQRLTPTISFRSAAFISYSLLTLQGNLSLAFQGRKFTSYPLQKRDVHPVSHAQQLRFISTYSSGNHPVSPDLSPSLDQEKLDPFSLVADELALLGHKLREMVAAEVPKLAEAAEYFFKLGVEGKRFRPMVLLLMASSLTAEDTAEHPAVGNQRVRQQKIAEITEMIHVASLLHDDVLDHADTRRGIGSLNHVMGNKLAVLAGDFLLARASMALASLHNTEVVELLSKVLEHLVTGEIMQLTTETQEICSMEYYMQKTFYKTASLMANSCKSIALLADQPMEVANLAFEYGRHLGLAFQLVDDTLDFIGSKASLGKPTLADLAQGIATAPVLFALEEHPRIYDLVNRKFRKSGDVDQALDMVRNSQGILRTQQLAAHHARQAALAIAALPPSPSERVQLCRRALTELTEHVITRSK